jgi:hypothetical protein
MLSLVERVALRKMFAPFYSSLLQLMMLEEISLREIMNNRKKLLLRHANDIFFNLFEFLLTAVNSRKDVKIHIEKASNSDSR